MCRTVQEQLEISCSADDSIKVGVRQALFEADRSKLWKRSEYSKHLQALAVCKENGRPL